MSTKQLAAFHAAHPDLISRADYIILAEVGNHESHVLSEYDGHWRYSERVCHSDQCAHWDHPMWADQDCTEDEARAIVAAFAAKGGAGGSRDSAAVSAAFSASYSASERRPSRRSSTTRRRRASNDRRAVVSAGTATTSATS